MLFSAVVLELDPSSRDLGAHRFSPADIQNEEVIDNEITR